MFMLVISEEERKEILSKYKEDTSEDLLNYLKRHFPSGQSEIEGWQPMKYVMVGDKMRYLKGNKKYLVGKISDMVNDEWIHLGNQIIRRTVKKYIDGITL